MRQLWKRCSLIFLSAVFTVTITSGCQKQQVTEKTKARAAHTEKILSYSVLSSINNLDPQRLNQMDASTIGYHIYEGLVRNEEGTIVPAGASSFQVSEDGLTYRFKLRKTKWKDGSVVVAKDYVRGIRRLIDDGTSCDYGFLGYYIKNGAAVGEGALPPEKLGVKAIGDDKLEIQLEQKTDYFLQILSMVQFTPLPKKAVENDQLGTSKDTLWENGPFILSEWTANQIVLEKNPQYWNAKKISLEKVVITKKNSIKEAREAYERGETNLLTLSYLPGEKEEDYSLYCDGQLMMVRINLKNKLLSNQNFRKALFYSIDQRELTTDIYEGIHIPAAGFVLPGLLEEDLVKKEKQNIGKSTYHPEKAADAMKRAKKEMKWQKKKPWKLTLICSDWEIRQQTAAYLKEKWEEILGITVELKAVPSDEKLEREASGDFDLILTKWVPDYGDATAYLENWTSDSPYNQGKFKDKSFDKKMGKAQKSQGEQRQKLLSGAEEILKDKVAAFPLYFRRKVLLTKNKVKGIQTYYVGYQYNYMNCQIEE